MSILTGLTYRCVCYPDFEPNHTWLRQMLLFVDEIHRIVPKHYSLDDSDNLKSLIELTGNAIQICEPSPYIEITDSQASTFGRALDQPRFTRVAQSKKMVYIIRPGGEQEVRDWEFLHVKKIGHGVWQELVNRKMLRDSQNDHWQLVPRGVGSLVVGMLADKAAARLGFDAVTDQPLAFALNSLNQCSDKQGQCIEGIIASTVASVYVPRDIALLTTKQYVELRKRHSKVRSEFAKMIRDLKEVQRMSADMSPADFRDRLDGIIEHVGSEVKRFRDSKAASKFNEWVPFALTSLFPIAATLTLGPLPGVAAGVFSFSVNTIAKLTKKSAQFSYPKVLQTFCAADDASAKAAVRRLGTEPRRT